MCFIWSLISELDLNLFLHVLIRVYFLPSQPCWSHTWVAVILAAQEAEAEVMKFMVSLGNLETYLKLRKKN